MNLWLCHRYQVLLSYCTAVALRNFCLDRYKRATRQSRLNLKYIVHIMNTSKVHAYSYVRIVTYFNRLSFKLTIQNTQRRKSSSSHLSYVSEYIDHVLLHELQKKLKVSKYYFA
jgi:hypothetical protein